MKCWDMAEEMGIDLKYSDRTIMWDGVAVKMHEYSGNDDPRGLKQKDIYAMLSQDAEPTSTEELTQRMVRILDAKYEKADLDEMCAREKHLTAAEQRADLKALLTKYEHLFDGTLGKWRTEEGGR